MVAVEKSYFLIDTITMVIYTITIVLGGFMTSSTNNTKESLPRPLFHNTKTLDVISIEECRKYLGKYELDDKKLLEIKNYLLGIIDKSINSYLDEFR